MMAGFTLLRLVSMMGIMGGGARITKEQLLELNAKLNQIKKPEKPQA